MTTHLDLAPEALAKLLLIQSFAGSLPGTHRMMEFVCSGLSELPGVSRAHFETGDPPDEDLPKAPYRIALRTGKHHHGDIVLSLDDEELFKPYRAYINNLGFTFAVFLEERRQRDIIEEQRQTLEKRVEEKTRMWIREVQEKEAAQQEARQLQQRADRLESLGILAGGIAHDFNNLCGCIFGFIELALDACAQNPEATKYLERSLAVHERARKLTEWLLTFAKGGKPLKKLCSLRLLLERSSADALTHTDVTSELHVPEELWPCELDERQMTRVIENIIVNAAEAMPPGGTIDISAENLEGDALGHLSTGHARYLRISIEDRGAGISQEALPRIFDPFFTTKPGAHGLGLAICHSIVKRHEGLLRAESQPGVGTTMHIYLPALASEQRDLHN